MQLEGVPIQMPMSASGPMQFCRPELRPVYISPPKNRQPPVLSKSFLRALTNPYANLTSLKLRASFLCDSGECLAQLTNSRNLKISISAHSSFLQPHVFSKAIRNLQSLEELDFAGPKIHDGAGETGWVFQSATLQCLKLWRFGKGTSILSLDCPQLEKIYCTGMYEWPYGSGLYVADVLAGRPATAAFRAARAYLSMGREDKRWIDAIIAASRGRGRDGTFLSRSCRESLDPCIGGPRTDDIDGGSHERAREAGGRARRC